MNYPTLPEAIRIGAKKRPQGFNVPFFDAGCSCVIGAAMEGSGLVNPDAISSYDKFWKTYPSINMLSDNWSRLIDMNDRLKKTREEIADILEAEGVTY